MNCDTGAAGTKVGVGFLLASDSSSSSACCAAAYPALAFARNAAPNPLVGAGGVVLTGTAVGDEIFSPAVAAVGDDVAYPLHVAAGLSKHNRPDGFTALPGGDGRGAGAGDPASAGDSGTSAKAGLTLDASNRIASSSSKLPSRITLSRASAVATNTSGPCGSRGRDLSAGCNMRPPAPVVSSANPTTKFESSSSPARGMLGTHRSSSTSRTQGPTKPSAEGGRTAHSWLSHALRCDASATRHAPTRRACAYGPTSPDVSSSSIANAPRMSYPALGVVLPSEVSQVTHNALCDSGSSLSTHSASSAVVSFAPSSPTRNAKPSTWTSTDPSSHGPTPWCFIVAVYPPSVSRATTTPPENGAHAASAPFPSPKEYFGTFSSPTSSCPLATAKARTPSAIATGASWSRLIALPTTSLACSHFVSRSDATSARYANGNSTSHCRSLISSHSSSSPKICTRNAFACVVRSARSLVWNKCTVPPHTAATVVSSGQKLTFVISLSGIREKSLPGTICSAGSFSFKLSVTCARRDVFVTHKPAWSANKVSPYLEDTATSLAYPGGTGKAAASSGWEKPTVPSDWYTKPPTSDSTSCIGLMHFR